MKAHLMFADADVDLTSELPDTAEERERDLDLPRLYAAMAAGDKFLYEVARRALLSELTDPEAIAFRQRVLRDCLAHPDVTRELYALAVEAIDREHRDYLGMFSKYPTTILHRSVDVVGMFVEMLRRLRDVAEAQVGRFESDGFRTLFATVIDQLSDGYFAEIQAHLKTLKFRGGLLLSAQLGRGNKPAGYVLRTPAKTHRSLADFFHGKSKLSFTVPERDEAGHQALADLRDQGINLVADAAARSADHLLSFFTMLRTELGFYVGCLNLFEALKAKGAPVAEPTPLPMGAEFGCTGLYDVALALAVDTPVVGNDVTPGDKALIVITGANRGGKSTFLRSVGLAQLMMQAGMFVPAIEFRAGTSSGVFTHFKREEDAGMRSGKLDEELARMSGLVDRIRPGGLLLCNESFASTNEREGSEIARQIVTALLESEVRVYLVTHLYELSGGLYRQRRDDALFLRAERGADGSRTFRLRPGEPLTTSFGPDVYARVFPESTRSAAADAPDQAAAQPEAPLPAAEGSIT